MTADVVLSALDLALLDAAPLDDFHFVSFHDVEQCGHPAGMVRRLGAPVVRDAIVSLLDRGFIELFSVGRQPSGIGAEAEAVMASLTSKERPLNSSPEGFRLTVAGGAAWEAYRRPNWWAFAHWLKDAPDRIACVAGDVIVARRHVQMATRMAGLPLSRPGAYAPVDGWTETPLDSWRETYWRPFRPAVRLETAADKHRIEEIQMAALHGRALILTRVARELVIYTHRPRWMTT